jgi:hypothetical protein
MAPEPPDTSFLDNIKVPYHHITVQSAIALAHLAGVLQQHGRDYQIKEASEASLTDVRSHPLILVGATNNDWTMRLVNPLRYRFVAGQLARIQDTKDPQNMDWSIDVSKPYTSITTDYAIVARFRDSTTEGLVMVVAGLGPYGTESASEFVGSPLYLEQTLKNMPAGWESKNFEMVLKSAVIDGKAGPPQLVSSAVW